MAGWFTYIMVAIWLLFIVSRTEAFNQLTGFRLNKQTIFQKCLASSNKVSCDRVGSLRRFGQDFVLSDNQLPGLEILPKPTNPISIPKPTITPISVPLPLTTRDAEAPVMVVKSNMHLGKFGRLKHFFGRVSQSPAFLSVAKVFNSVFTLDFYVLVVYHLTYSMNLRYLHHLQTLLWQRLKWGTPLPWKDSMLGFVEERGGMLGRIMLGSYLMSLVFKCLPLLKITSVRQDIPTFVSRVALSLFAIDFADKFINQFLPVLVPHLAENRRQLYVFRRSLTVLIWLVGSLMVCEMISTFLRIPMASILAFGGVGGLAIGLSTKDMVGNFLGGLLLLINEPFTPGVRFISKFQNPVNL